MKSKPILMVVVMVALALFAAVAYGPAETGLVEAQTGEVQTAPALCPPPPSETVITLWRVRYRVKWIGVGTGGAYDCPHYRPYLVPEVN